MNLTQFETYVRRRHRAVGDSNWASEEIYELATGRCNEILTIIGLLEETSTDVTVATTQSYNLPSDCVRLVRLQVGENVLQELAPKTFDLQMTGSTWPAGDPITYKIWERQVVMSPIPSTAGQTITFHYEKEHPYITGGSGYDTILIPSVLHWRLADGVIGDMYAKDLNEGMAKFYEDKWLNVHMPAFYQYVRRSKRGGRVKTILDCDTYPMTDYGNT